MPLPTASQAAAKWAQAMQGASTAYSQGIQRVQENPMEKAAANQAGWLQGIQEAANSGKWAAGLRRRTKEQWQQACVQLGAMRLGPGATAAQPKMEAFMTQFLPYLATGMQQIAAMPNQTFEQRKARAIAMMDYNHGFRRS